MKAFFSKVAKKAKQAYQDFQEASPHIEDFLNTAKDFASLTFLLIQQVSKIITQFKKPSYI